MIKLEIVGFIPDMSYGRLAMLARSYGHIKDPNLKVNEIFEKTDNDLVNKLILMGILRVEEDDLKFTELGIFVLNKLRGNYKKDEMAFEAGRSGKYKDFHDYKSKL